MSKSELNINQIFHGFAVQLAIFSHFQMKYSVKMNIQQQTKVSATKTSEVIHSFLNIYKSSVELLLLDQFKHANGMTRQRPRDDSSFDSNVE